MRRYRALLVSAKRDRRAVPADVRAGPAGGPGGRTGLLLRPSPYPSALPARRALERPARRAAGRRAPRLRAAAHGEGLPRREPARARAHRGLLTAAAVPRRISAAADHRLLRDRHSRMDVRSPLSRPL